MSISSPSEASSAASLGAGYKELANLIHCAAEQADAAGFIECLESGYGICAGPSGCLVSGGQRKRIALARALIRDPKTLVLDEATAVLDSAIEKRIQLAVKHAAIEKRIVVSIARRLSTIRNADTIIAMQAGRVVEQGTYIDLMAAENGEFARMAKLQTLGSLASANREYSSSNSLHDSTLHTDTKELERSESKKDLGSHVSSTEKIQDDKPKEETEDAQEPEAARPFSFIMRGIAWLIRPPLGWLTIAIITAVFNGSTFSGSSIIFGFTISILNPTSSIYILCAAQAPKNKEILCTIYGDSSCTSPIDSFDQSHDQLQKDAATRGYSVGSQLVAVKCEEVDGQAPARVLNGHYQNCPSVGFKIACPGDKCGLDRDCPADQITSFRCDKGELKTCKRAHYLDDNTRCEADEECKAGICAAREYFGEAGPHSFCFSKIWILQKRNVDAMFLGPVMSRLPENAKRTVSPAPPVAAVVLAIAVSQKVSSYRFARAQVA
ncbi:hypothetical protein G7046_g6327 [Stylonectria norvegica]|nr:hypothetical protein G7046_g6327 [Stylonectria norvegica]